MRKDDLKYIWKGLNNYCTKWDHYFPVYERYLSKYIGEHITMLEIGVLGGGSLEMWRKYLGPGTKLVGVDIDPICLKYADKDTDILIGDQEDPVFLKSIVDRYKNFDVIIDDGGHTMKQQIASLNHLYPSLADQGVYLCEDTHTNYWDRFGGGLNRQGTFIEYTKEILDVVNSKHIVTDSLQYKELNNWFHDLESVHYHDSIVVLEKGRITNIKPVETGLLQ